MVAPLSREVVIAAVAEYGMAWTTQDPDRIAALFTAEAVYVERAFDRKATFRGRDKIKRYWEYQICGKQSNIRFRHIESEMVIDAERPVAVVKWLAEFDNHRENRAEKAKKRVRFCQMAKLHFHLEKGRTQIAYLEEYAQSIPITKSERSPVLDASDESLWAQVRMEPIVPTPVACDRCSVTFPSRTKLFEHLRTTDSRSNDADGQLDCVPNTNILNQRKNDDLCTVCFSVTYSDASTVTDQLSSTLSALVMDHDETASIVAPTLSWAVPPELSYTAIVNVAAAKLPRHLVKRLSIDQLFVRRLNELGRDLPLTQDTAKIIVHATGVTDRMFTSSRREFERYAAFIPWSLLQTTAIERLPQNKTMTQRPNPSSKWRMAFETTSAAKFVDSSVARRIKDGGRIISNIVQGCDEESNTGTALHVNDFEAVRTKVRVRTSTMKEPWQKMCHISISMRQSFPKCVERLVGLLVAYTRLTITEEELVAGSLLVVKGDVDANADNSTDLLLFPSAFVCLMGPVMTRYESKTGLSLCASTSDSPIEMQDSVQVAIDIALQRMDTLELEEGVLQKWCDAYPCSSN